MVQNVFILLTFILLLSSTIDLSCGLDFEFRGPNVTQQEINEAILAARLANNITDPSEWLTVDSLIIVHTRLPYLQLDFLAHLNLSLLTIYQNFALTSFIAPPLNSSEDDPSILEPWQFSSQYINLADCAITDAGLVDFLKLIVAEDVKELLLDHNPITGTLDNPLHPGFVPYLSSLGNLESFSVYQTPIKRIGGSPFKNNTKLKKLHLSFINLEEIGENAFSMNEPEDPSWEDILLEITVGHNDLTEEGISVNNGLETIERRVSLTMNANKIQFLEQEKFEKFLSRPGNTVNLFSNPIFCDSRMKWLKEGREIFENAVYNVDCQDGESVFDSPLVD